VTAALPEKDLTMARSSSQQDAQLEWTKALKSIGTGACLELAPDRDMIALRDSKHPERPALRYTKAEIDAFTHAAKRGEFDHFFAARQPRKGFVRALLFVKAGVLLPCIAVGQLGGIVAATNDGAKNSVVVSAAAILGTPALIAFALVTFTGLSAGRFSLRFAIRQGIRYRAIRRSPAVSG
jgi:Domain of unknown function (DUF397)